MKPDEQEDPGSCRPQHHQQRFRSLPGIVDMALMGHLESEACIGAITMGFLIVNKDIFIRTMCLVIVLSCSIEGGSWEWSRVNFVISYVH